MRCNYHLQQREHQEWLPALVRQATRADTTTHIGMLISLIFLQFSAKDGIGFLTTGDDYLTITNGLDCLHMGLLNA